ncbi:MAG TPA: hypothetical protein VM659_24205 [Dongiaceae bacterium]|nr:hypothetical protein [Dongiaceae bacterium]
MTLELIATMLPKFMPDLFQPIRLPRIIWRSRPWSGCGHLRLSSGYQACSWMRRIAATANDN